jgi:hypothetical protein
MQTDSDLGVLFLIYEREVSTGLILVGSFVSVPPTTASKFALGARVTDRTTGYIYINRGTVAVPVWESGQISTTLALSAANIIAMYATPVAIVAAVPGKAIVIDSMSFDITRTSTAFSGGGVVAVQYDSTANGAGTATTATIAATVVTGAAGRTITARIPVVQSDIATASITGIGLYISNATAAFAAGTGTASVKIAYHLV